MERSIFLAGASGAIGRRLAPLLVADGWRVAGTTRSRDKTDLLRALGVEPVVVDVFDAGALDAALAATRPKVVVHQLTDLPPRLDPAKMPEALLRNARIREEGTRNLIAASLRSGARRIIAQSIAFAYADGPTPHVEGDPLAGSARGPASLESQTLAGPLEGVALRYGRLYGPGTGFDAPHGAAPIHVDAAARAAQLAARGCEPGIYNIAEDDGAVSSEKAKRLLPGWSADWRSPG